MRTNPVAKVIKGGGISDPKLGLGAFGENINAVIRPMAPSHGPTGGLRF